MIKRFFILAFATLILTSCARWHRHHVEPVVVKKPVQSIEKQNLQKFTKLLVIGNIDVYVHPNAKYSQIILHGEGDDILNTSRIINDGELVVTVGKGYPKAPRLRADIYTNYLSSFAYHGSGNIVIKGLTSKCMDLLIDNNRDTLIEGNFSLRRVKLMNSGHTKIHGARGCAMFLSITDNAKLKLSGYTNIATLNMSGNSNLSLYWVKSKTLNINLKGNARLQLAGITEILNIELWDKSIFNGRYLMSQNSFVKTHNNSIAKISVTKNQHTLAQDRSDIHYYFLPKTKTDFMAENGAILDMREWEQPFLRSPNLYNS